MTYSKPYFQILKILSLSWYLKYSNIDTHRSAKSVGLVFALYHSLSYPLNWFTQPVNCSVDCSIQWLIQSPTFKSAKSDHFSNIQNPPNIDQFFDLSFSVAILISHLISYSLNWFTEPVHCSIDCSIHWPIQSPTFKSVKFDHFSTIVNPLNYVKFFSLPFSATFLIS